MADTTASQFAKAIDAEKADALALAELHIDMPDGHPFVEYRGTRALLEAEGIVPQVIEWPEWRDEEHWTAGGQRFYLKRERPPGFKGPERVALGHDWWKVRIYSPGPGDYLTCDIRAQRRKLAKLEFRNSPEGLAQSSRIVAGVLRAGRDDAFQQFLSALLPAARNGRKAPK